jgi:hypothetical protein
MAIRTSGAIVSRFGDISPAFAAAFGASVDVAFPLGARRAQARAVAAAARDARRGSHRGALPVDIASSRGLPTSRVQVGVTVVGRRDDR